MNGGETEDELTMMKIATNSWIRLRVGLGYEKHLAVMVIQKFDGFGRKSTDGSKF